MALTNNLKVQVDLPTWEWCRFAPTATTAVSSLTTGNTLGNRYLYYQVSGECYRYDTYTDSWNRMTNMTGFSIPTIMNNNVLTNAIGHFGRAIGPGVGNKQIQLAGLSGNALVGYKIRIIGGTGAGQERTITAVSAPTVHDRGIVTTAGTQSIIDASTGVGLKQWTTNQWRDYQFRCDYGTGRTQLRPILYNTINSLTWSAPEHMTVNPWANPLTNISVAANALYQIESHIATVDADWLTNPDSTSKFMILSGGIWNITQATTTAPFFSLSYYDILADQWYGKGTQTNLIQAVFTAASDLSLERMTENGGTIFTEQASGGGARYISTTATLTPMQYANFEIRIVSGTGWGQTRGITSNTASRINVVRDWATNPDNTSVYEIWRDVGKLYLVGGGYSHMLQYDTEHDQWTVGRQLDNGQCNQLAAKRSGQEPFALTSITRTVTGMVATGSIAAGGTGYNINDLLTVDAKGGVLKVTSINSTNGAVTGVSLEQCGTGYAAGTNKATTVTPSGGTGCQITLAAGDIDFTELAVTPIVHDLKVGDSVVISGASGTGAAKFNGTYTILGVATNGLSFSYCSVGDPGAATATIANSPSTVQIVDCTKNWAVDEHKGKLVQLSTNALLGVGQMRRIVSNTATTLVWTLAATAPVNGTTRYVITKPNALGTEVSNLGKIGGGNEGFATNGSTTTLEDSTKNWQTNCWSRTAQRKVRIMEGTGVGNEIAITSNTATTLTYATQTFTPDATTRYIIMDAFGTATGGTATTLVDSSQNWDTNIWVGKRVRLMAGTGVGNEYAITANTSTTLTYASGATADVSTAYSILEANPKTFGLHLDMITGSTDTTLNSKYMYSFVGSATVQLERYNVTTEHWELISYFPQFETNTTGAMYCYDGADRIYICSSTTLGLSGRMYYYDLVKNVMVNAGTIPYGHSTLVSGNRMEIIQTADGLKYLYMMRHSAQEMWRTLLYF
jgi:hypothetical protein